MSRSRRSRCAPEYMDRRDAPSSLPLFPVPVAVQYATIDEPPPPPSPDSPPAPQPVEPSGPGH
jgi:hypothetical protein